MNKQKIGMSLIVGSLLIWVAGRSSQIPSQLIGKLHCGDRYLQAVDGVTGDVSCGFNDDMYLNGVLLVLLLVGFVLRMRGGNNRSSASGL